MTALYWRGYTGRASWLYRLAQDGTDWTALARELPGCAACKGGTG